MKKQNKIILWIIGILIVLLLLGTFVLRDLFSGTRALPITEEDWIRLGYINDSHCEIQTINGTEYCLPEGVCEFQKDSEGRKSCLLKKV